MNQVIRDPAKLNDETRALYIKQEGIIIVYNLPFRLFETWRSHERQLECLKNGTSWVEHSKHEDGEAWDIVKWGQMGWSWEDADTFWYQVLGILTVSLIAGVKWGADWNGKNFWFDEKTRDYCHYERIIT